MESRLAWVFLLSDHACKNVPHCVFEGCGNGIVEDNEECDDGNLIETDGCYSNCTWDLKKSCMTNVIGWTSCNGTYGPYCGDG